MDGRPASRTQDKTLQKAVGHSGKAAGEGFFTPSPLLPVVASAPSQIQGRDVKKWTVDLGGKSQHVIVP